MGGKNRMPTLILWYGRRYPKAEEEKRPCPE
jgi:hypothetical protein